MESILDLPRLRSSIERHEGRSNRAYRDSEGALTVGVGHNLEVDLLSKTWSDDEIDLMLNDDIAVASRGRRLLPISECSHSEAAAARASLTAFKVFPNHQPRITAFWY